MFGGGGNPGRPAERETAQSTRACNACSDLPRCPVRGGRGSAWHNAATGEANGRSPYFVLAAGGRTGSADLLRTISTRARMRRGQKERGGGVEWTTAGPSESTCKPAGGCADSGEITTRDRPSPEERARACDSVARRTSLSGKTTPRIRQASFALSPNASDTEVPGDVASRLQIWCRRFSTAAPRDFPL